MRSVDVCRWTYLLGFPQLDPSSGEGLGADSPSRIPWRSASKSASTVSLVPSFLFTSILVQICGFRCELLEDFRWSVVQNFGEGSYLKSPKVPLLLTSFYVGKKNRPQSRCAAFLPPGVGGHFHLCLFIPVLSVNQGAFILSSYSVVTHLDSFTLNNVLMVQRPVVHFF